jgi:hypothetical protein
MTLHWSVFQSPVKTGREFNLITTLILTSATPHAHPFPCMYAFYTFSLNLTLLLEELRKALSSHLPRLLFTYPSSTCALSLSSSLTVINIITIRFTITMQLELYNRYHHHHHHCHHHHHLCCYHYHHYHHHPRGMTLHWSVFQSPVKTGHEFNLITTLILTSQVAITLQHRLLTTRLILLYSSHPPHNPLHYSTLCTLCLQCTCMRWYVTSTDARCPRVWVTL